MPDVVASLQDLPTIQHLLPIWTDWGLPDTGVSIHSLGVSLLVLLGQHLNYVAVSEFPAPRQGLYAQIGDDVRSDAVWFDRQTRQPCLIAEFERYSGISDEFKLEGKVKNLLLAHHRWGETAKFLVLAYWTNGHVSLPRHSRFQQILHTGFETPGRQRIAGTQQSRLLCFQFLHWERSDNSLQLDRILQRGTA